MIGARLQCWLLGVAFVVFAPPARAGAQGRETAGLVAGIDFSVVEVEGDSTPRGVGALVGGMIGVGITSRTIVYFDFDIGAVRTPEARMVGHSDLAGRFLLGRVTRLFPYAEAGFAARILELSNGRDLLGTGLMLGIGAELPLRPGRNLDVGVIYWIGAGDDLRQDGETIASGIDNGRSLRLRLGYRVRDPTLGRGGQQKFR